MGASSRIVLTFYTLDTGHLSMCHLPIFCCISATFLTSVCLLSANMSSQPSGECNLSKQCPFISLEICNVPKYKYTKSHKYKRSKKSKINHHSNSIIFQSIVYIFLYHVHCCTQIYKYKNSTTQRQICTYAGENGQMSKNFKCFKAREYHR